jgi:dipeptidyl-peptidase-4
MTLRTRVSCCSLIVAALLSVVPGAAQVPAALRERLAAIYERNDYPVQTLGTSAWLDDGRRYTLLTRGPAPQIVAYDSAAGDAEVLATTAMLTPPGASTPLAVSSYQWSADASRLLLFTNTRRVWRLNTRGDYWVLDRAAKRLRRLGGDAPDASLMFAKFSPDGRRVAYVRDRDIYVEDVASGAVTRLTSDGGENVVNGTADWVNEEELRIRDAFRWSPDGSRIAYWQFDTTGVGRFTLVNNTAGLYPELTTFPYPKAGTRNSAVRVGVVPASGGVTTWLQAPGDPREHYVLRMQFLDPASVVFLQSNRAQNEVRLLVGDVKNGAVSEVFAERADAWLDAVRAFGDPPQEPAIWFDDRRQFTWISDKDGWSHVYAVSRATRQERLLTQFDADVIEVRALSPRDRLLYLIASPDDATQRYLYAAALDDARAPRRITPADQPGTHTYDISPDGRWAFHTYSTANRPPRTDFVALPAHTVVRTLVDNDALAAKVARTGVPPVEFVQVSAAGVTMDGYVVKPASFDAAAKYPVIVYVYGEVAGVTVMDRWLGSTLLFQQALADSGYVVVSFDNPGTPAPKGARWRKSAYKAVNHLAAAHQAAAVKALASQRSYLDLDRVGIYGTSGGGSNTLNALFREPSTFKVGVAMAPLADLRFYDTIYQERYSGLPEVDRESYDRSSAINFADGLAGKLLLIHGTGDDNVHVQNSEALVDRLVALGKPFDQVLYPNRSHALSEGQGTTMHRWQSVAGYFLEHLPPGPRPVASPAGNRPAD